MLLSNSSVQPGDSNAAQRTSAKSIMKEDPEQHILAVARAFVEAINVQDCELISSLMAPDFRFVDAHGRVTQGSIVM